MTTALKGFVGVVLTAALVLFTMGFGRQMSKGTSVDTHQALATFVLVGMLVVPALMRLIPATSRRVRQ